VKKRIKLGILLFIIATTLSLILLGCSQEPFNNNVRENKAKEQLSILKLKQKIFSD